MMEAKQAACQWKTMTEQEKKNFEENLTESLMFRPREIQEKVLFLIAGIDTELVKNLEKRLYF